MTGRMIANSSPPSLADIWLESSTPVTAFATVCSTKSPAA
jgi:hypothetical protein